MPCIKELKMIMMMMMMITIIIIIINVTHVCVEYISQHSHLNDPGFESRQRHIFIFLKRSRPALGLTQPPIQRILGFLSRG
jgi:hypothetical protein